MDISQRCNKPYDCESIQWAVKNRELVQMIVFIPRDYYERLKELLTAFDSISNDTRYEANDKEEEKIKKHSKKKEKKNAQDNESVSTKV